MKWVEQSYTHTFKYSTQCTHMPYDHQLCTCSLSASSCDMACTCCWVTAWASDLTHLDPPTCSLACVCVSSPPPAFCVLTCTRERVLLLVQYRARLGRTAVFEFRFALVCHWDQQTHVPVMNWTAASWVIELSAIGASNKSSQREPLVPCF